MVEPPQYDDRDALDRRWARGCSWAVMILWLLVGVGGAVTVLGPLVVLAWRQNPLAAGVALAVLVALCAILVAIAVSLKPHFGMPELIASSRRQPRPQTLAELFRSGAGAAPRGRPLRSAPSLPPITAGHAETCAYCQTEIPAGMRHVACPLCGIPYHADCWRENGGCAVYGCKW
jgi:hypothetical protein